MKNAREVSFDILKDIFENEAYSNLSVNKNIKKNKSFDDEAFIRELVYGVLENAIYLDYIIGKMSKIKLNKINKDVFIILRMGIYQMLFLDSIPDRAAVFESVELVKKLGNKGGVGFTNGMLRNFSRNKEKLAEIKVKSKREYISIKYSHPIWMVDYFIDEFGEDFAESLCKANNEVPKFTIRYNSLKTSKDNLKKSLESKGFNIRESEISKYSLIIENPRNMLGIDEYKKGLFTIQDESSSLVGEVMDPKPGSSLIDTCAAPGGKTTHFAEIMKNEGEIIALDIHPHRVNLISNVTKRLGIDIIDERVQDALVLNEEYLDKFDYCLIDAPCSGLGTIKGNPEIKIFRKKEDVDQLVEVQKNILNISKRYIKSGGRLIYSTCTIGSRENDDVVNEFLKENKNFELLDIKSDLVNSKDNFIKLYPNINGSDGFFISVLRKK